VSAVHPELPRLTGLTGVGPLWDLPRVNILVSSLFTRVAVVSRLVCFGAW
jgi:hypothetical protein